jgi:NADH-quinone oxidoreductase subunit C
MTTGTPVTGTPVTGTPRTGAPRTGTAMTSEAAAASEPRSSDAGLKSGPAGQFVAAELAGLADLPLELSTGQEVIHPSRERYLDAVAALKDVGFAVCADLCAVDYLGHLGRRLPSRVAPERFEVVVNLLSHSLVRRVRLRVQVPADDAVLPSLFGLYPGTENMEREAYDLFGVTFSGHPDLTRILLPEDWEGHPLRKDYAVGRVPVQFREAPGPR